MANGGALGCDDGGASVALSRRHQSCKWLRQEFAQLDFLHDEKVVMRARKMSYMAKRPKGKTTNQAKDQKAKDNVVHRTPSL